ncbi:neurensin-1-like, partial [Saccoglossus kowalevskii]
HPSLTESDTTETSGTTSLSSDFGVKSYLHHFYEEDPNFKDSEDVFRDDYQFLIPPSRRRCSPFWWKAAIWAGINLLILGTIALLIGYLVPQRKEILGYENDSVVIDDQAVTFNYRLDVAKLAGLVILCVGGFVLAIALLIPAFIGQFDDDELDGFKVQTLDSYPPYISYGTTFAIGQEDPVPCTSQVKSVQPKRTTEEAVVAKEGAVNVQG